MGPLRQAMRAGESGRWPEAGASGFSSFCSCCVADATERRERRRLLDLVELLEHPGMPIPADLALRLSVRLLAGIADDRQRVAEAVQ